MLLFSHTLPWFSNLKIRNEKKSARAKKKPGQFQERTVCEVEILCVITRTCRIFPVSQLFFVDVLVMRSRFPAGWRAFLAFHVLVKQYCFPSRLVFFCTSAFETAYYLILIHMFFGGMNNSSLYHFFKKGKKENSSLYLLGSIAISQHVSVAKTSSFLHRTLLRRSSGAIACLSSKEVLH
jgi:hypothetical protein